MSSVKPKQLEVYRKILEAIESRSTCHRLQVGAVLVLDDRPISTGWNGVPSGHDHCCDIYADRDKTSPAFIEEHRIFSENNELHAEQNCLMFAAKKGIKTDGADLYITYSPCKQCAKLIIASGIKRVFYKEEYDRQPYIPGFLEKNGIEVQKL